MIDDCIVTNAGDHLYMVINAPPFTPPLLASHLLLLLLHPRAPHPVQVINAGHEEIDIPHIKKHMKEFVATGGKT